MLSIESILSTFFEKSQLDFWCYTVSTQRMRILDFLKLHPICFRVEINEVVNLKKTSGGRIGEKNDK